MFFATLSKIPILLHLYLYLGNLNGNQCVLKFLQARHKGILPELFNHFFQYASNVYNYNTRYVAVQIFTKSKLKQTLAII